MLREREYFRRCRVCILCDNFLCVADGETNLANTVHVLMGSIYLVGCVRATDSTGDDSAHSTNEVARILPVHKVAEQVYVTCFSSEKSLVQS